MSDNCSNSKHPLFRDGTSQQQRLLKALLPSFVSVDERSMDDLIAFAKKYAKEINFFDQNNNTNGDWVDFFTQEIDSAKKQTEPHYALFIAFLDLFRTAQDNLNTITQRHLDFYYREVLQLKEKVAVPDQVFMIFDLAKQVTSAVVKKSTALNAGKDGKGKALTYTTDKDIVVNKALIQELKAVFANKTQDYRIYASPIANSGDGIGGKLLGDEPKWRTFGRTVITDGKADRTQGDVGFAFASPVLFMSEGSRAVTITLTFNTLSGISDTDLKNAFRVQLSGAKKWIEPEVNNLKIPFDGVLVDLVNKKITITRTISEAQPAIVAYDASKLGVGFDTTWPVMRVLLDKDETKPYVYKLLKSLVLKNAQITVDVKGVRNLILYNDQAKLKADKPFEPFTSRPIIGSSFYIGSTEVFSKQLDSVDVSLTWHGLPPIAFNNYYHSYIPPYSRLNAKFMADVHLLDGKKWVDLGPQRLFDDQSTNSDTALAAPGLETHIGPNAVAEVFPVANVSAAINVDKVGPIAHVILLTTASFYSPPNEVRVINISNNGALKNIPRDSNMLPATVIDAGTFKGFLRLELRDVDFGHKDYALTITRQVINNGGKLVNVVNQPYTPTVKEIALNYTSSVTFDFSKKSEEDFNNRVDQFYHVQPFGINEIHPFLFLKPTPAFLVPQFEEEGTLYIGIDKLKPSQILSILFKVSEGSANPDFEKQKVVWSYMVKNQWVDFPKLKILADGTNGLLTSGIISFDIPSEANNNNTILTPGLHWLRATVANDSGAVCDLLDVRAQAATATFINNANDPEHLRLPLPGGTIAKFRESNSLVHKVSQPFASFGGKMQEQSNDFYVRVSERLRHKHRAVTIWDYERLVLEKFPSIYKVKCISHTEDKPANYSEIAPGHVALITVANLRNKNIVNPLQPKTSLTLMEEIHEYILSLTSCWVELDVRNPDFEEIRTTFNVRFMPGFDNGFYGQQLNEDLKKFLSPWTYDSGADISFGGSIHRSSILSFVEERDYVDFVSCFKMDQLTATQKFLDIEEAITTTAASVLVSTTQHFISVLESDDCACDDNIQKSKIKPADDVSCDVKVPQPPRRGIGADRLNGNFIVGYNPAQGGIDFLEIENDFNVS